MRTFLVNVMFIRLYILKYKFDNKGMLILHFENSTFGIIMSWSGRVTILFAVRVKNKADKFFFTFEYRRSRGNVWVENVLHRLTGPRGKGVSAAAENYDAENPEAMRTERLTTTTTIGGSRQAAIVIELYTSPHCLAAPVGDKSKLTGLMKGISNARSRHALVPPFDCDSRSTHSFLITLGKFFLVVFRKENGRRQ